MLYKLQRKTLPKGQLLGYAFALMVAVVLLGGIWQLYRDVKPLLEEQTDIFSSNYAVVTKPISAIGSLQKEMIYFTPAEQESLRQEPFVKSMAPFLVATFKIMAYTRESEGEFPLFATDLFLRVSPISISMSRVTNGSGIHPALLCLLSSLRITYPFITLALLRAKVYPYSPRA